MRSLATGFESSCATNQIQFLCTQLDWILIAQRLMQHNFRSQLDSNPVSAKKNLDFLI